MFAQERMLLFVSVADEEGTSKMIKNRLQERDNNLPNVEYDALLKIILEVLKKHSDIFDVTPTTLHIQVARIAEEVVNQVQRETLNDVRPFVYSIGTTHVTANFLDGEAFHAFGTLIERIRDQLFGHLKTTLAAMLPTLTPEAYIRGLVSGPRYFVGDDQDGKTKGFSVLSYPFRKSANLKRRQIHLQARNKPTGTGIRLLGHKLTISVRDMLEFEQQLVEALCNQLEEYEIPIKEIERARAVLRQRLLDENSELGILTRIVKRESFGRLQKEAKIRYLDYIIRALNKKKSQDNERALLLLPILTHRVRLLEAFLREDRPDEYYQVSYNGFGANYRSLFSRSEALDLLPIFADIEGALGETYNKEKGEQEFILGVKLKLNGGFRTYDSVFAYYLTLLDPSSKEHQERKSNKNFHQRAFVEKVLKLALLYYFVFRKMDDPDYNPTQDVERELLATLKLSDEQADREKQRCLKWLTLGLSAQQNHIDENLQIMRTSLKELVKSSGSEFDSWPVSLYLSVSADIIETDEDRMRNEKKFFSVDALAEKGMGMLKYITVEDASAAGDTLCSLPVSMAFEPMYYYSAEQTEQQFSMAYNIQHVPFLPVIYMPNTDLSLCQKYYENYKHIAFPYATTLSYADQPALAFVFHFAYLLLNYLCLKLFSDSIQPHLEEGKRLFFPLVRIHHTAKVAEQEEKSGEEEFLRALSKALSHILREQGVLANAQGLHVDVIKNPTHSPGKHKLPNALSSLYSVLPKVFTLPSPSTLENLAIIVVSSRKCDAHKDSALHLSTIYGEVIGIRKTNDPARVRIVPLDTFSANEASDNMYRLPTVLQDQAKKCYLRGYRHILYVAQAPYSSSLHLTSAETADEQFFMSGSIIESLKGGHSDLHIYPVYCDRFYVVKINGKIVESLYVDDTSELRSLLNDPNRNAVVFFNLLNGLVVGREQDRLYNGVVSYATLINVYDDPIYDQDIRNHLLDGSQAGSLKNDILDFLTLLHFARYEREAHTISMKLDPYDGIIGSDSVGTLSLIDHMEKGTSFNMLGFLAEVRNVLNRQYSGYVSTLIDEGIQDDRNVADFNEQKNGEGDGSKQA